MDTFDKAAIRFLRRVRRTDPTPDQLSALVACLMEQMSEQNRAKLWTFAEHLQDRVS